MDKLNRIASLSLVMMLLFSPMFVAQAQNTKAARKFQRELNKEFRNPEESPLTIEDFKKFKKHAFFPIDAKYRVVAQFTRAEDPATFKMKTSTKRQPLYEKYGTASFEIDGVAYELTLYKSLSSYDSDEYQDYLFLPYNDLTNGEETYYTGRYIDFSIPETNQVTLDFNKAYNPYCAYSDRYSCAIPPAENDLNIEIKAGIMYSGH